MVRISSLIILIFFTFSCYGQNKASQINSATNGNSGNSKIINPEGKTPFPYNHFVDCGIQDKNGNLWFGTSDGIYCYDGKSFFNYRVIDGLGVDRVSKILEDGTGNIWFCAFGGIVRCDPAASLRKGAPSFTSINIPTTISSDFGAALTDKSGTAKPVNSISHIIEDKSGNIWFCAGYNVYRYDSKSGIVIATGIGNFFKTEKVKMSCGIPDDFGIVCICEDKQGNLLFSLVACCGGYDVTNCLNAGRVSHRCVLNTCRHDLSNQQDLAAHDKEIEASFTKITREDNNANMAASIIFKDRTGNIWAGGDGGVYRYDGRHFVPFSKNDELSKSIVTAIYEDKAGNLWFGTGANSDFHGNGVFCYNPALQKTGTPSVRHFTTKDGLCSNYPFSNNVISQITEDNTGKIWFGGDAGICNYNPSALAMGRKPFINFTEKEGMKDDHVSFILEDNAGLMWFGTWNLGLYRYSGKSLTCFTQSKSGS